MNIRSITQSSATFLKEALLPNLTSRQKTILWIACAALAFLAACFFARRYLSNKVVPQHADQGDKQTNKLEISIPAPAATNPPAADVSPPKKEDQKADPAEQLKPDNKDKSQSISTAQSPAIAPISGLQGLDRESVKRIINYQGTFFRSKDFSIEECEAFAPDLLKFLEDGELQKSEFYPTSELPDFVRIAYEEPLEKYLGRTGLRPLIRPTLRLMVLKGTLAWCGGNPRCGVYAGFDLAHKKKESGCLTREDLLQFDTTMQRDCWKSGDLAGLTPEEAALYDQVIESQNRTIYSRCVHKTRSPIEIPRNLDSVGISLLQKLVLAGKIYAYNFTLRNNYCHIMLTAQDVKKDDQMRYKNWVDKALLQNYESGLIRPVLFLSNDVEQNMIDTLNQARFARLTSDSLKALEYRPFSTQNVLRQNVLHQSEQVLQQLVQGKQIHAYAKDLVAFYIQLTAQDDISKLPSSLVWKYS